MNNKVLINLELPEIKYNFDVFIPMNEVIWKVKKMLIKCVEDITDIDINKTNNYLLVNKFTGRIYKNNEIVLDTDIRNTTELFLIFE